MGHQFLTKDWFGEVARIHEEINPPIPAFEVDQHVRAVPSVATWPGTQVDHLLPVLRRIRRSAPRHRVLLHRPGGRRNDGLPGAGHGRHDEGVACADRDRRRPSPLSRAVWRHPAPKTSSRSSS